MNIQSQILYKFFIDMNEDQHVYKNLALVLEKLQMSLFIGIFGALGGVYVLLFVEQETPIFWQMVILFDVIIGGLSQQIIYTLRKTKTENVIDMILYLQIIIFLLITNNLFSFCSNSIFYPDVYEQLFLNNEVMIISFISLFFISNYPKILAFSITEVVLMYQTIRYPTQQDFKFLLWIHIQVIVFFVWLVIQQTVLIDSFKERSERMEMTAVIMHDLRNQVQSLNDMNKAEESRIYHHRNPLDESKLINSFQQDNERDNHMKFIWNKVCFLYHLELIYDHNYQIKDSAMDSKTLVEDLVDNMRPIFMYKNANIKLFFQANSKVVKFDNIIFEQLIINLTKQFLDLSQEEIQIYMFFNAIGRFTHIRLSLQIESLTEAMFYKFKNKLVYQKLIESLKFGTYFYIESQENCLIYDIQVPTFNDEEQQQCTRQPQICQRFISHQFRNNNNTQSEEIFYSTNSENNSNFEQNFELSIRSKDDEKKDQSDLNSNQPISQKIVNIESISQKPVDIEKNEFKIKNLDSFPALPNFDISDVEQEQDPIMLRVYVNVDDEESILRMNKRICKKEKLSLNLCLNRQIFFNFLGKIHNDIKEGILPEELRVVVFMDHVLDCDMGQLVIDTATQFNQVWGMNIEFILLSSTEGKDTLALYHQRKLHQLVSKPLTKPKLKQILDHLLITQVVV